ncbi:MAG: EAL domain-containing protein [Chloroflexi bacterium]|nr:EAL domain-containing protein [Chloroflexota bacterium]
MNKDIILIVDDSHESADFLAKVLLPRLGYDSRIAYDAPSAVEILRSTPVALMLLNLEVPGRAVLDMLARMSEKTINVPTILITADDSQQIKIEALRLGVVDYLTRPLEANALQEAIERALTQTRLSEAKEKLARPLEEHISWLAVLQKVGQSLTSTLDLDEVLCKIVEAGVYVTKADEGFLALLDQNSGQLYLRAVKNIDEARSKTMHIPLDDSLVGCVVQSGRPYRSSRVSDLPQLKICTGYLVHSLLYVPLLSGGKVIGVLAIDNRTSNRLFTEQDEARLLALAGYAVVALQNARFFRQAQQELAERKRIEQKLRVSEERYALAMKGANDGLWDWDFQTNTIFYSTRWKSLLGYEEEEIGSSPDEWFSRIHPDDIERTRANLTNHIKNLTPQFQVEHRLRRKDDSYIWTLSRGVAVRNKAGTVIRMAGSLTDISDHKAAEEKLLHDAFYDPLTGLPNRALFMDHLRFAVERVKRRPEYQFAVLFLDIDGFKNVNDSLGHLAGDQLLVAIGNRLSSGVRTTDLVSRLSGDEFVILLEETDQAGAERLAERIEKALANPFRLHDQDIYITASVGIVLSNRGYYRAEDVLRDADIAMYAAKARGKARHEFFKDEMRDRVAARVQIETTLSQALENQQLRLFYQPVFNLKTGRLSGLDATVYWDHPEQGLLPASTFMHMVDESHLILPLFDWTLTEACRQMRQWQQEFSLPATITMCVSISAGQLRQRGFPYHLEKILRETDLLPQCLRLELDENMITSQEPGSQHVLEQLRKLGVRLQVNDLGLGFSFLRQIGDLPLATIKLNSNFTSQVCDPKKAGMLEAVLNLIHQLGFKALAEGITQEAELYQLQLLECEYGKGPLLSDPLPAEEIKNSFTRNQNLRFDLAALQLQKASQ